MLISNKKIDITMFSSLYDVRKLDHEDIPMIFEFCKSNTQYYAYCGKENSYELIESDLQITPPGIPLNQKYYVGFFAEEQLVAIMDLIDGYPDAEYIYIGFFMVNSVLQGTGIGTNIIQKVLAYLCALGFQKCQLAIDKDNPQSNHFWRKNGFEVIREVEHEGGELLVAEKKLHEQDGGS